MHIDFYFDFSSAYSYIGQHRIRALARQHDVELNWKPMVLGAIFKALGHHPTVTGESPKKNYIWRDVARSAEEWGLPYRWPDPFPFNAIQPARAYYWLEEQSTALAEQWAVGVFDCAYGQGLDCTQATVLGALAESMGLDPQALAAGCSEDAVKLRLREATDEALQRGVFGAPTFLVDNEIYWGADRVDQIERRLSRA